MCIFDKSGEYRDSYICSEHITLCFNEWMFLIDNENGK